MNPGEATGRRSLGLTRAADIQTRRQAWLWENYIPSGTLTLFAGRGGEYKSTFSLHLAAEMMNGSLPGNLFGSTSPVLIVSYEDDWETITVPRLVAAGANLNDVFRVAVKYKTSTTTGESVPDFPADLPLIAEAIVKTKAKLVIVDPITSTMQGDQYKVSDVRAVLDPLTKVAQDHDVAVIGIMHFNKGRGDTSNMLSGSHAFRDVARSVLHFATDPETGSNVISVDKSSYSAVKGDSLAFTIESVDVATDDGQSTAVARVSGVAPSSVSVSDIVNRDPEQSDAVEWLIGYLRDAGGSASPSDVKAAALADGLAWRTVERARKRADVDAPRRGYGGGSRWVLNGARATVPAVPATRLDGANGGIEDVAKSDWNEEVERE